MSHLSSALAACTDIDILRKTIASLASLGLVWNEGARTFNGKKTFTSYYCHEKGGEGGLVLDEQIARTGTLEHSITIRKGGYEIGVVRKKDGEGWALVFDPYDSTSAKIVGAQCEKVMAAYGETTIRDWAESKGFMIE